VLHEHAVELIQQALRLRNVSDLSQQLAIVYEARWIGFGKSHNFSSLFFGWMFERRVGRAGRRNMDRSRLGLFTGDYA
jgi:hypothetical protein